MVTDREQKGLQIAALRKIKKNGMGWLVPSQTSNGHTYKVDLEGQKCTCPDSRFRDQKCKHIFAVEYTIQRETITDGETTVTKTTETVKVTKVTYRQDWTAYNAAQTEEKSRFMELLADLCSNIPQPEQIGAGRPRLPMSDMVFASAYKVYSCFSSRRFTSDLRDAYAKGFVNSTPHFNSVNNYLADPDITPILGNLITISSLPLKSVEHDFAIDSSGFSTSRFVRWFNKKYGKEVDNREWVKVHLMCGVKTNVVTGAEVSGWAAHDTNYFEPLLERTAQYFQIDEVSGDKAYLSKRNLRLVESVGGMAYVPFKSNSIGHQGHHKRDTLWEKMWHYFNFNREIFLEHYHKRSNTDST
jgi:DDE family transposase/SWIM zinc finger